MLRLGVGGLWRGAWKRRSRFAKRGASVDSEPCALFVREVAAFHPRLFHCGPDRRRVWFHPLPASSSQNPPIFQPNYFSPDCLVSLTSLPFRSRKPRPIEFLSCPAQRGGRLPLTGSSCSQLVQSGSGHRGQNVSSLFINAQLIAVILFHINATH